MNDLRDDPNAHAPDKRAYSLPTVKVLTAEQLHTVPMPELRSPQARTLDAEARDLRTAGDKIAELQQQVSTLQAVCSELSRRVTALEARPLAMAEDAWGVG